MTAKWHFELSFPDSGARSSIAFGKWRIRPKQPGVTRFVRSRKRHKRAGCPVSSTGDLDLSARQVDLSATDRLRLMKSDTFHSDEIVPRWNALRYCKVYRWYIYHEVRGVSSLFAEQISSQGGVNLKNTCGKRARWPRPR